MEKTDNSRPDPKFCATTKEAVMRRRIIGKLAITLGAVLIVLTAAACANMQVRDKSQAGYNFSKIKSIVILPFYESYKSSTDMLFSPVNSKDVAYESLDVISMELFDAGIKVVDRMHLDKVLDEQKLSLSGLMEKQDYRKIGKLVNADAILWGSILLNKQIGKRGGKIAIRLIDVETGTVIYTSVGEKSDVWGGADVTSFKTDLMSEAGKKLSAFLSKSR